jgi:hypothetical protein
MAEAKRRARRRRLLLALGVAAGGAVAVTLALQSSAGPGGAPSAAATAGAGSGGAALNEGPVLAGGVAPVTGGRVVASVTPDSGKVGTRVRLTQIATAPIDASGNFVLRPDPTSRVLAPTIVEAITSIARQYVDVSGKPSRLPSSEQHQAAATGSATAPAARWSIPNMRLPYPHPKARIVDEESLTAITRLGQCSSARCVREDRSGRAARGRRRR